MKNENAPSVEGTTDKRPREARWVWRLVRLFWAPLEILRTLNSIDNRLAKIEAESERLGRCIDNHNHQRRYSLMTGHWNDGRSY
jgi:hypothetical protein